MEPYIHNTQFRMSILMIMVILTTDAQPIALSGTHVVPVGGGSHAPVAVARVEVSWSGQ